MTFFSTRRSQKKPKHSTPRKPKIRWHLLGLPDPIQRDSASSIDNIRQGVTSLAREYPFTLQQVQGKRIVRPEPKAR